MDFVVNSVSGKVVTVRTTACMALADGFAAQVVPGEGKITVDSDLPGLKK